MARQNHDIFPVWTIFSTIFNAFYEQRLNCEFSVRTIRKAHDYFILCVCWETTYYIMCLND